MISTASWEPTWTYTKSDIVGATNIHFDLSFTIVNPIPTNGVASATVADTLIAGGLGNIGGPPNNGGDCFVIDYKTTDTYSSGAFSAGGMPTDPVKTTTILTCTVVASTINFSTPALEAGYTIKVRVPVTM